MSETLILSTSLSAESKTRILAKALHTNTSTRSNSTLIDMRDLPLPFCDAGAAYSDANVATLAKAIEKADAIIVCSPIYNYTINSVLKNLIEMTGKVWTDKVVGFAVSAGGQGSYMAVMQVANWLMLDFRTVIVPRFVYANPDDFDGMAIKNKDLLRRLDGLSETALKMGKALS